jgi:type I restriction enzyme M protein
LYVRGNDRDLILPMTVIRRLDALLEDLQCLGVTFVSMEEGIDKALIAQRPQASCGCAG